MAAERPADAEDPVGYFLQDMTYHGKTDRTRDAYERMSLRSDGMEFASEMIMEAGARDMDIVERPITYHERTGEATLDSFEDGWRHVRFMLLNAPGYLFSVPGLVVGLVGAALMLIAAAGVSLGGANFGVRTLLAGSLSVITGVQVASFGIYATIASDPIRRPTDPVTELVTEHLTLESGVLAGVGLFGLAATYATWMIVQWIVTGYQAVPTISASLLAFTGIVVGMQVVFGSFFVGIISSR